MVKRTDGVGTPGDPNYVAKKDSTYVNWAPDLKAAETKKLNEEIINALKAKHPHGEQSYRLNGFEIRQNPEGEIQVKNLDRAVVDNLKASPQGEQLRDISAAAIIDKALKSVPGFDNIDKQLKQLLEAGAITQEQYEEYNKKIHNS